MIFIRSMNFTLNENRFVDYLLEIYTYKCPVIVNFSDGGR